MAVLSSWRPLGFSLTEVDVYDGLAQRCGIYRSQLERQWANWFHLNHIHADYVDQHWYDFEVAGYLVEIKPHGQSFLFAALDRMPTHETLVVIQGSIFNNLGWLCHRIGVDVDYEPIDVHQFFGITEQKHDK